MYFRVITPTLGSLTADSSSFAGQLLNTGPGRGNPSGEPAERAEGGADATAATAVDATVGNGARRTDGDRAHQH